MLRLLLRPYAVLALLLVASPLRAEEGSTLEVFGMEEPVVAASRIPRPVSKIAENVTVITAEQIARLNAHTLADVLNTVPGVQIQHNANRTPGGDGTDFFLQGAPAGSGHVLVLIDGVQLNRFMQGWADVAMVPVQQIERVEIIKGAASAAWGQALGGVVNVITKSADPDRKIGGEVSASYGERDTTDARGEVSGSAGAFGYYLSGGKLYSRGFLPNNRADANNGYVKLTYELPSKGVVSLGGSIIENGNGLEGPFVGTPYRENHKKHSGYTLLNLSQPLTESFTLDVTGTARYTEERLHQWDLNPDGTVLFDYGEPFGRESAWGGSAKLRWGGALHGFVAGIDYEHGNAYERGISFRRSFDRYGVYANGLITLGDLSILPSVRFDDTGFTGDYVSWTLGATYRLGDKTVLRAYGARGYATPVLSTGGDQKKLQRVWTVQTGVETTQVPYIWLKGTLFYNRLHDATADNSQLPERRLTRQGFEVEARTLPWHGLAVTGGYTFNDSRNADRDRMPIEPWHIGKLGLLYDNDSVGLKGTLTGNYAWWNTPPVFNARYDTIIWDLHLSQKIPLRGRIEPEIFFSAHNLFNGAQYFAEIFRNAPRWFEGGVRFKF